MTITIVNNSSFFFHQRASTIVKNDDGSFNASINLSREGKAPVAIEVSGNGDDAHQRSVEHALASGKQIHAESAVTLDRDNKSLHREGTLAIGDSEGAFTKDLVKTETGYTKDATYAVNDKTFSRSTSFEKTEDGMSRQVTLTLPGGKTVTRTITDTTV